MKLVDQEIYCRASILAERYGCTIAEARKLKLGEEVKITKPRTIAEPPKAAEVKEATNGS